MLGPSLRMQKKLEYPPPGGSTSLSFWLRPWQYADWVARDSQEQLVTRVLLSLKGSEIPVKPIINVSTKIFVLLRQTINQFNVYWELCHSFKFKYFWLLVQGLAIMQWDFPYG